MSQSSLIARLVSVITSPDLAVVGPRRQNVRLSAKRGKSQKADRPLGWVDGRQIPQNASKNFPIVEKGRGSATAVTCVKSEYLIFPVTVLPLTWIASQQCQTSSARSLSSAFVRSRSPSLDEGTFGNDRFPAPVGRTCRWSMPRGNTVEAPLRAPEIFPEKAQRCRLLISACLDPGSLHRGVWGEGFHPGLALQNIA